MSGLVPLLWAVLGYCRFLPFSMFLLFLCVLCTRIESSLVVSCLSSVRSVFYVLGGWLS